MTATPEEEIGACSYVSQKSEADPSSGELVCSVLDNQI